MTTHNKAHEAIRYLAKQMGVIAGHAGAKVGNLEDGVEKILAPDEKPAEAETVPELSPEPEPAVSHRSHSERPPKHE